MHKALARKRSLELSPWSPPGRHVVGSLVMWKRTTQKAGPMQIKTLEDGRNRVSNQLISINYH